MLRSWKDITRKMISISFCGLPVFRFEWQLFFLRFLRDKFLEEKIFILVFALLIYKIIGTEWLTLSGPGFFLGAWAGGGGQKVPAAHNSKTIRGVEVKTIW